MARAEAQAGVNDKVILRHLKRRPSSHEAPTLHGGKEKRKYLENVDDKKASKNKKKHKKLLNTNAKQMKREENKKDKIRAREEKKEEKKRAREEKKSAKSASKS